MVSLETRLGEGRISTGMSGSVKEGPLKGRREDEGPGSTAAVISRSSAPASLAEGNGTGPEAAKTAASTTCFESKTRITAVGPSSSAGPDPRIRDRPGGGSFEWKSRETASAPPTVMAALTQRPRPSGYARGPDAGAGRPCLSDRRVRQKDAVLDSRDRALESKWGPTDDLLLEGDHEQGHKWGWCAARQVRPARVVRLRIAIRACSTCRSIPSRDRPTSTRSLRRTLGMKLTHPGR